jgi:hypothetical protein
MKSNLEYEYRPYTTKNILLTFAASGALGLLAMCGGVVLLGPRTTDSPGPRSVSIGTLALEEAAGRDASSALRSFSAAVMMVLCGALAPLLGYSAVRKCHRRKQRIALLPKGLLLPSAEKPIEYRRVRDLSVGRVHPAVRRAVSIDYNKGKRCTLWESGLPSAGAFDELHAVLKQRTEATAGNPIEE